MKRALALVIVLAVVVGLFLTVNASQTETLGTVSVTFTYVPVSGEKVTSVSLRGSFNNWGEWPMKRQPDGSWSITVQLAPGTYQYKYYINGKWPHDMATGHNGKPVDLQADKYVDDGFGGQNAVRIIKPASGGKFYAIHDPSVPAYRCIADGKLVIRLQVAPGLVKQVTLVIDKKQWPMERQLFWDYGEVWRVALPNAGPFSYRFVGERVDGTHFSLPQDPNAHFTFSGINLFPQLGWVEQSVGYEIFPDRFCNGDPQNDALALKTDEYNFNSLWEGPPPLISKWNGPITPEHCCHQYFGGDFAGILSKLDYLSSLGVTLIYLTPVFESGSAHGYDTHDYLKLAPRLGTKEELHALLNAAHARGMRVLFDFVPDHTGLGFWAFQDIVKHGPKSPYWDWYFIRHWPFKPGDSSAYEGWWNLGSLPKLNTGNPEVRDYLYKVVMYWLNFGFDGFRVDVPNELVNAHSFFAGLRKQVKAAYPNAYMVGEIWQLAPEWVKGDEFDSLMNYALGRDILLPYAQGKLSGTEALGELSHYYASYGENVAAMGFNLISSHDTSRLLTDLGGGDIGDKPSAQSIAKLKLVTALLYALPGMPVVFHGDERGYLGSKAHHDAQRYPIQWDEVNSDVLSYFMTLAQLRKELPSLRSSAICAYKAEGGVLAFFRGEDRNVLVVANNSTQLVTLTLPEGEWHVARSSTVLQGKAVVPPVRTWILLREGQKS